MSSSDLCVITVFFNPAKYKSLLRNYLIFRENLKKQNVKLITIELTFFNRLPELNFPEVIHLNSNSIMWQKECLINYAINHIDCEKFAWVDCDVLFSNDNWVNDTSKKLDSVDVVQLFKRVYYLPKGHMSYNKQHDIMVQSVIWQAKTYKNWLNRRKNKELPFSSPGFAWAAKKSSFQNGLYDLNIVGSGDTFMVDCLLNSWDIHGFAKKFTPSMKSHMIEWLSKEKNKTFDFLPDDIYHLNHGSLKNRAYMDRHNILLDNDFDPTKDIVKTNGVLEWSTNKINMHKSIEQYFFNRNEDDE